MMSGRSRGLAAHGVLSGYSVLFEYGVVGSGVESGVWRVWAGSVVGAA
ncbi:hypothetical protein ACFQYP_04170 [Nonomuraea antimicrobica]